MTDLPPDEVQHDDIAADESDEAVVEEHGSRDEDVLADTEAEIAARALVPVETGHPAVDEVLRSLSTLDDLPVDEHVAVFERAHEELRRTLSGAGDDQA